MSRQRSAPGRRSPAREEETWEHEEYQMSDGQDVELPMDESAEEETAQSSSEEEEEPPTR